jgi:hypothetical protein
LSFTSVTLITSFTVYPSDLRNRANSMNTTNGRAFPTWIRLYTVGPQA